MLNTKKNRNLLYKEISTFIYCAWVEYLSKNIREKKEKFGYTNIIFIKVKITAIGTMKDFYIITR